MFTLDKEQLVKLSEWVKILDKKVIEQQRLSMTPEEFTLKTGDGKVPYYGAIGGGLTYSFTPTSLGLITKIEHSYTGEVLDVTDYNW